MAAGERAEFRHEMRVRQKADVEDQVGLFGDTMTKAKAHTGNQNTFLRRLLAKTLGDVSAQFVNVKLGRIDDDIDRKADACEVTTFGLDRGIDRSVAAQRMRSARLAETP